MSDFFRILLGFFVVAVGVHMVMKTDFYFELTGPIKFAEDKLGGGGTRSFLKILGVVISFIGMAIATDLISDILGSFAKIFVR